MINTLLLDAYRVLELLGEGGMAKVYLAENERIGRKFALKLLLAPLATETDVVERFFREAKAAAALQHPGIVEVIDCAKTPQNVPFMVMELLHGEDLETIINRGTVMEIDRVVRIAVQTADALDAAHSQGIVHRDIKPGNLFLVKTHGGGEQIKILDFGIARLLGKARLTSCGQVIGTPMYMSPEQARGDDDLDHRSDIYSLGATLYNLVCGKPPFPGDSNISLMIKHLTEEPLRPIQHRPDIPKYLEQLLLKMLAKDPSQRPQTSKEVQSQLNAAIERPREMAVSLADTVLASPQIVEEIRMVTVLVADFEAAVTGDVEMQIQESARIYDILAKEIRQQGGKVEPLAGHRAVGLFGINLSFGDEPIRAARSAFTARERIGQQKGIRIAIGTGRILALSENVSTGPAASNAAKLLERLGKGGIAVDSSTFRRIRGIFRGRPLPEVNGMEPAFELEISIEQVGLNVVAGPFGKDIPVIGRDDELEQLWDIFTCVQKKHQPSVISITGESGIGKSRIKTEFVLRVDSIRELEVFYLEGVAQALVKEQPFSSLGSLLRRRARLPADCSEEEAHQKLRDLLSGMGIDKDQEILIELLSIAAGVGVPRSPSIVALKETPQRLRNRVIDAFKQLIVTMARKQPVLFCMEDAQHMDRSSIDALLRLLDGVEDLPIMMILIGLPEMIDQLGEFIPASGAHYRMALKPLSRSETRNLVAMLLGSEPPRPLQEAIWKMTDGVPLFVEEFLFSLRHRGTLLPDPASDGWKLADNQDLSQTPKSVEGMLQARLDALSPDLKEVIRRAAVIGTVFWDDALAALGVTDIKPTLSALARREIIIPKAGSSVSDCQEYAFRSMMLHDVAYKMIPRRMKIILHSKAANWLSARGCAPAILARHLEIAEREEEAAAQYLAAGDLARDTYANDDALHQYDRALRLASKKSMGSTSPEVGVLQTCLSALFGKENILARLGRRNDALEALDRIDDLAARAEDMRSSARAAVRRGALVRLQDPREAIPILENALEKCRASSDFTWECRALHHLGQAATYAGDFDRGTFAVAKAVEVARNIGSKPLLLRVLLDEGTVAVICKGPWHGLSPFREALELAQQIGNVESEADILQRLGFLCSELGDLEAAESNLNEARVLTEKTGNRRILAFTLHNLGWVLWKRDKRKEALLVENEALEVSREAHLFQVALETDVYLALFDIGQGNAQAALEKAGLVRQEALKIGQAEIAMHAQMAEALALLFTGKVDEAADASVQTIEAYEKLGGTQQFEVELHLVAAKCLAAAGRHDEAAEIRAAASSALDRRTAPMKDPDAVSQLLQSIGIGLPLDILTDE